MILLTVACLSHVPFLAPAFERVESVDAGRSVLARVGIAVLDL